MKDGQREKEGWNNGVCLHTSEREGEVQGGIGIIIWGQGWRDTERGLIREAEKGWSKREWGEVVREGEETF